MISFERWNLWSLTFIRLYHIVLSHATSETSWHPIMCYKTSFFYNIHFPSWATFMLEDLQYVLPTGSRNIIPDSCTIPSRRCYDTLPDRCVMTASIVSCQLGPMSILTGSCASWQHDRNVWLANKHFTRRQLNGRFVSVTSWLVNQLGLIAKVHLPVDPFS